MIFREAFASLSIEAVSLIVGRRSNPNLKSELIGKRSPMHLLRRT